MKNLKRTLSLALASVMLLGMMVIGTSAATFTDADAIVNTEAATITAGLGLFAGSEGKFNPTGTVTRAQMATVIVKMLYGSEINADSYKGSGKFSDVASFEGGWAEGYINLCANLGIVGGYGDGTFKPGQNLTTAEAVTMLLNALKVDAGEGTWPLTVMAAAEKIELYEDMQTAKPSTNDALTRDQLSVLVWNALNYSPEGTKGYMVNGVKFTDYMEAYFAAGQVVGNITVVTDDSLATKVFGLKSVEGFITANQETGIDTTMVGNKEFAIETGLDQIGHYVTVYFNEEYTSEKKPGKTYTIVDECEVVKVNETIDSLKTYRAAFGTKAVPVAQNAVEFNGSYVAADVQYNYVPGTNGNYAADKGTYVIYDGEIVAYMAPVTTYAAKVTNVVTTEGKEAIYLSSTKYENNATLDSIVEYDGIAKGDYVTYVMAQSVAVLSKVQEITGKVDSTSTETIDNVTYAVINMGGKSYMETKLGNNNNSGLGLLNVNFGYEYTLYVTAAGRLLGMKQAAGSADVADVVYVVGVYSTNTTDNYGNSVNYYYAQAIDMNGKESQILIGIDYTAAGMTDLGTTSANVGFYKFDKHSNSKAAAAGVMEGSQITATAYNEETAPLFVGTSSTNVDEDTTSLAVAGVNPFLSSNTKFIVYEGQAGESLNVVVLTGAVDYQLNNAAVLMSQNANKNNIAEVVMVNAAKLSDVTSSDFIYLADSNYEKKTDLGFYYDAFNGATGEKMEIVTGSALSLAAGFYTYSYDAAEGLYEIDAQDALTAANYIDSETFGTVFEGKMSISNTPALNAADVKIVDIRTAKTMEQDEIDEITTLDELVDLTVIDEKVITVSVYADKDLKNAIVLFVESIANAQQ